MAIIDKLHNRHMLVMIDEDSEGNEIIVTGTELEQRLIGLGFSVPELQNHVKLPLPSADIDGNGHITNEEIQIWNEICAPIRAENAIRLANYFKQFTDFASFLRNDSGLVFARLTKMREGRKTWNVWRTDVTIAYGYQQASERLIGKYSKGELWANRSGVWVKITPIEFIAYEYFG